MKENNILVAKKEPTKKYTFEIIKVKNSRLDIKRCITESGRKLGGVGCGAHVREYIVEKRGDG